MKFTKTHLKRFIVSAILLVALNHEVFAGGFPVRPKSLLLSPSVNYFFANKGWDSLGIKKPFLNNGQFSSFTYSLYAEYGISRRFTFVALLPYVINNFKQTGYNSTSMGLSELSRP